MGKANHYTFWLMRSGDTLWDRADRLGGRSDIPLAEGVFEDLAERAITWDAGINELGMVYCSPDEASLASAAILAQRSGAKVKPIDGLAGMDYGLWEGVVRHDLEERSKSCYRQWLENPNMVNPPEGEPVDEARDRVLDCLARVLEKTKGAHPIVGVVLRPAVFGLALAWLTDQPTDGLWGLIESAPIEPQRFELSRAQVEAARERSRARA